MSQPKLLSTDFPAIYRTRSGQVSSLKNGHFALIFKHLDLELKPTSFFNLRNKIKKIRLGSFFDEKGTDVEIVYFPSFDKVFILTLEEIIEMKDLMDGTIVMLELNSIIHRQIVRQWV